MKYAIALFIATQVVVLAIICSDGVESLPVVESKALRLSLRRGQLDTLFRRLDTLEVQFRAMRPVVAVDPALR